MQLSRSKSCSSKTPSRQRGTGWERCARSRIRRTKGRVVDVDVGVAVKSRRHHIRPTESELGRAPRSMRQKRAFNLSEIFRPALGGSCSVSVTINTGRLPTPGDTIGQYRAARLGAFVQMNKSLSSASPLKDSPWYDVRAGNSGELSIGLANLVCFASLMSV